MRDSLLNYLPFYERKDGSITRELLVDKNTLISLDGFPIRVFAAKGKGIDFEVTDGILTYNFNIPKQKNMLGRVLISHAAYNGVRVQLWDQTPTTEYPIGWIVEHEAYTWSDIQEYVFWRNRTHQAG